MDAVTNTSNPSETVKYWVTQYADKMYSWAYFKTGSKENAEDLVQDSFLAALTSFSKFEGRSNPQTWLFVILNHKISDHYRKIIRNPVQPEKTDSYTDPANFFDTVFDRNMGWLKDQVPVAWPLQTENLLDDPDFEKVLSRCMKKLPEKCLSAIQLKYLEEKKAALICQELGVAATNYWQLLHRGKLQLRKCLELNWFKI